ncbi:universal stress protein [Salinigranum marinum]|uniref:universal stress protein n=1 Tax=Salinigranum marinum TaxID=1515595 RepID=UPI002989E902|nr:universal stress protein [Salinigranum marinum]
MRLLVAIDGTDAGADALDYALDMAVRLGASLLLTYVVEPAAHVTGGDGSKPPHDGERDDGARFVREAIEDSRTTGDDLLHEAANRAAVVDVDADTHVATGDPVEVLPALADETSVDAIVVGHRRAADREAVGDSVAKGLIERSPVPVTVVT